MTTYAAVAPDLNPFLEIYFTIACATILVYDYLCTLPAEISNAWPCRRSFAFVLFFVNRYSPFADTFIFLHLKVSASSPEACWQGYRAFIWLLTAGSGISNVILILRTCAMWNLKRQVVMLCGATLLIVNAASLVVTRLQLVSFEFVPSEVFNYGCYLRKSGSIILVAYILTFFSESTIVSLTLIRASQHIPRSSSAWVARLYQNGIFFCFCMLGISLANVLVPVLASPQYKLILASPQRILHSIFCNRVMLLILENRKTSQYRENTAPASFMAESLQIFSTVHIDSESEVDVELDYVPDIRGEIIDH
ncbi:hypothetical protein BDQ17DRAFT_1408526 [Cyathus striatus]|nr:hypothetical protein BDQ17DRAFT_1408526 [Cyathus striatus]